MQSSSLLILLFSILLLNCQLIKGQDFETHPAPVSQDYINAIDAATQEMIIDTSFIDEYKKLMFFTVVPQCTSSQVTWPKTNPFSDRKGLVMCIDSGVDFPYQDAKLLVANTLVKKINNHYGINLQTNVKYVNTTTLGFFETLKNAVNSGICDVISVNAEQNDARRAFVHFQCPWGTNSKAYLRTEREPERNFPTFKSLNQSNVIISSLAGTTYENDVKTNLKMATYIPFKTIEDQWNLILNKQVHAVVYNAITLLNWLNTNKENCKNCSVILYNDPFSFSTFTTNNISASVVVVPSISIPTNRVLNVTTSVNTATSISLLVVNCSYYWLFTILLYLIL